MIDTTREVNASNHVSSIITRLWNKAIKFPKHYSVKVGLNLDIKLKSDPPIINAVDKKVRSAKLDFFFNLLYVTLEFHIIIFQCL